MRPSTRRARPHDPTIYPVEEKVGEDILQRWIVEVLRPLLERWLTERGLTAFVGADQFIYWRQHDPLKRVAPDVYVLPGVRGATHVRSWKTWETGVAPSFCLEIVSTDWEKDYAEAPAHYDAAGARELVVFDPAWQERPDGLRWQVYRQLPRRGFVRVEATNADRVRSKTLGAWLRAVGEGVATRIRLGIGPRGDQLVPTAEEAAHARIAELEAQLARGGRKRRR